LPIKAAESTPVALAELVTIEDLDKNEIVNFVAVKIGDLTGDAVANANSTSGRTINGTLEFSIDDVEMKAGNTYNVDFRASDFNDVTGYQFTLNFDAEAVEFAGMKSGELALIEGNFGTTMLSEGVITTSWTGNAPENISDDAILFSLVFEATSNATLSNVLAVSSRYTIAEAYTSDDMQEVALTFNTEHGTIVSGGSFELYQNKPNPFAEGTVISFNLPEAGAATVTIYDVSGRVLKSISGDYTRGYNEITVKRGELATGVMYYQLDTDTNSATKKMIMID